MISERSRGRLSELVERHYLDTGQHQQLEALLVLLASDEHAPTSARDPDLAVDIHIADSLSLLELDLPSGIEQVVDVGSGAGFPGLPVAIARPSWRVGLLESLTRKCAFIEHATQIANVGNARTIHSRAEECTGLEEQDLVLVRALASHPVVLEYAAPLLRLGGMLVDWRGRRERSEEAAGAEAAETLGLELREIRAVRPFDDALHRHLHIYTKVCETPTRFPRRPGMALKRPLGAGSRRASGQAATAMPDQATSDGNRR